MLRKDVSMTFRMPQVIRDGLQKVASRDMRSASQYLLKILVEHLVAAGELTVAEGPLAVARAPRSDSRVALHELPADRNRRGRSAEGVEGNRLPRNETAHGARRGGRKRTARQRGST
jgi:hypothetical protein